MKEDVLKFFARHADTNFRIFNVGANKYDDAADIEVCRYIDREGRGMNARECVSVCVYVCVCVCMCVCMCVYVCVCE